MPNSMHLRRKWITAERLIIGAVVVALSVGLLAFCHWCLFPSVMVKVVNQTNHVLKHIIITFGDGHRIVQKLNPGEEKSWNITGDHGEGNAVLTLDGIEKTVKDTYLKGGVTRGSLIYIVRPDGVQAIDETWY